MKRLLPRTLFGQIVLALFAGLLVMQILGLWLMLDDRSKLNYKLLAEYSAQRMGGIVVVLDQAEPAERPALARALSVLPTTLSLDLPWQAGNAETSAAAKTFMRQVRRELGAAREIQVLSLEQIDRDVFEAHFHRASPHDRHEQAEHGGENASRRPIFSRVVIAQAKLGDGSVVTFHHALPALATDLPHRILALLVLLGLSVLALSAWAVRRLTRPLAGLADAAAGLARNLNQPPLPESGPQEVRRAAEAFNAMQRDLKRLIDTRAQALSAVSHDLRLPITRMRLRLEALGDSALRDKMAQDLGEMDTMIGDTLDFLRASTNVEASALLNLDALLDSVCEDMEALGARIHRSGQARRAIAARPHALRRCIANLLENARCYGGDAVSLAVEDSGSAVRIIIEDQGPGIPAAEREKVFEPYYRLESSRARHTGGTGLGLTIVKAIVEAHYGTITLGTAAGGGLRVELALPQAATNTV